METAELEKHVFATDTDVERLLLLVEDIPPGEITIDGTTIKCIRGIPDSRTYERIEFHGNEESIVLEIIWSTDKEGEKKIEKLWISIKGEYLHAIPKFRGMDYHLPLDVYNAMKNLLEKCHEHHGLNNVKIEERMASIGDRARKILGMGNIGISKNKRASK